MISNLKISEFIDCLASSQHIPGGGACAALNGVMGASLLEMVCNITLKRPSEQDEMINSILMQAHEYALTFEHLIDRDMKAFDEIMKFYAIPKADRTESEKQRIFHQACQVSQEMIILASDGIVLANILADLCRPNILSDVRSARLMFELVKEIAKANLEANEM
jgi:formiminotetrahydrofolate cyclodeaminase